MSSKSGYFFETLFVDLCVLVLTRCCRLNNAKSSIENGVFFHQCEVTRICGVELSIENKLVTGEFNRKSQYISFIIHFHSN